MGTGWAQQQYSGYRVRSDWRGSVLVIRLVQRVTGGRRDDRLELATGLAIHWRTQSEQEHTLPRPRPELPCTGKAHLNGCKCADEVDGLHMRRDDLA